jgi:hypothetical protein
METPFHRDFVIKHRAKPEIALAKLANAWQAFRAG